VLETALPECAQESRCRSPRLTPSRLPATSVITCMDEVPKRLPRDDYLPRLRPSRQLPYVRARAAPASKPAQQNAVVGQVKLQARRFVTPLVTRTTYLRESARLRGYESPTFR
jgi:hypothetical protein